MSIDEKYLFEIHTLGFSFSNSLNSLFLGKAVNSLDQAVNSYTY